MTVMVIILKCFNYSNISFHPSLHHRSTNKYVQSNASQFITLKKLHISSVFDLYLHFIPLDSAVGERMQY